MCWVPKLKYQSFNCRFGFRNLIDNNCLIINLSNEMYIVSSLHYNRWKTRSCICKAIVHALGPIEDDPGTKFSSALTNCHLNIEQDQIGQ